MHAWTDSTTALAWIRSSPHRWDTFVDNRTSQIQQVTSPSIWRHIPTKLNPVDCASRGLFPSELKNHPLWWTDPHFLLEPVANWPIVVRPTPEDQNTELNEHVQDQTVLCVNRQCSMSDLLDRFSSLEKIVRIVAYCRRMRPSRVHNPLNQDLTASELATLFFDILRSTKYIFRGHFTA